MTKTHEKDAVPNREQLLAEIRGAGLRATASRLAVLQVLHKERRPLSHSDVIAALADHTWDRSTLYRNLMDLAEAGLLRRAELGDRTWRFEVASIHGHAEQAAHFLCRICGLIACLPDLVLTRKDDETIPEVLLRGEFEVQILGRCDTCLEAA